jgi:hypothetical protein
MTTWYRGSACRAAIGTGRTNARAAAACAELAGEYAALFAAERGLLPGPVLDEVARLTRRRGAAVHHALAPDSPVGNGHELPRGGEA